MSNFEQTAKAPSATSTSTTALRVLLADDDIEMRSFLADLMVAQGFSVTEVPDGAVLIEALEGHTRSSFDASPFDVVVTDHRMPGAEGGRAVEVLRKYDQDLPVLVISGFADDNLVHRLEKAGKTRVMAKPFEPAAFLAQLDKLIAPTLPAPA